MVTFYVGFDEDCVMVDDVDGNECVLAEGITEDTARIIVNALNAASKAFVSPLVRCASSLPELALMSDADYKQLADAYEAKVQKQRKDPARKGGQ